MTGCTRTWHLSIIPLSLASTLTTAARLPSLLRQFLPVAGVFLLLWVSGAWGWV
jgi:hypothetical protein